MSNRIIKNKVNISKENKIHFWSIFTTGLVGLFSLWLGVSIQDDINSKNALETKKLARYQMVEAVYPRYEKYIDTCGYVFYDFMEMAELPIYDSVALRLVGDYYQREHAQVVEAMINSVNFLCSSRYYFAENIQEQISINNVSILFGLRLLDYNNTFLDDLIAQKRVGNSINDSIVLELRNSYYTMNTIPYRKQVENMICKKCERLFNTISTHGNDKRCIVDNVVYEMVFLPYINNFEIFLKELTAGPENSNNLGKHIFLLVICIILSLCLCAFLLWYVFDNKVFIRKEEFKEEKHPTN